MSEQCPEQHYETVCIIHPDTDEATVKEIISKTSSAIEGSNGSEIEVDEWGRKRLAYPIQKKNEGYYVLFTYTASAKTPAEVDRALRFREDIMRYQTVKIDERVKKAEVKPAEVTPEVKTETATATEDKGGA